MSSLERDLPWPAVRHAIRQKVARAGETVGRTEKKGVDDTDERRRKRDKDGREVKGGEGASRRTRNRGAEREKEKEPGRLKEKANKPG